MREDARKTGIQRKETRIWYCGIKKIYEVNNQIYNKHKKCHQKRSTDQDKQHFADNQEMYSVYNRRQQHFKHIRAEDMRTLPIHRPPLP
jgi:hypothetical protein